MRSIWKGHIRFSLVTIPIRVYNAIESTEAVRFNQLHVECNGPVGHEKKCKKCGKAVTTEEIVKGFQYEPEHYVVMEPADFEKIRLKSTRIIEIEGFVKSSEVPVSWYDSPYYVGPDGDVAAGTYALLSSALEESGRVGIGKVVLRDREDVCLIAPMGKGIVLYKLRYPSEMRSMENVPDMDKIPEAQKDQLKLAENLIDSMSKPLKEIELKNRYNDALREIINARIAGKEIVSVQEEELPAMDIMAALKASIERAKGEKKPMAEAAGKTKKAEKEKAVDTAKGKKPAKAKGRKAG